MIIESLSEELMMLTYQLSPKVFSKFSNFEQKLFLVGVADESKQGHNSVK